MCYRLFLFLCSLPCANLSVLVLYSFWVFLPSKGLHYEITKNFCSYFQYFLYGFIIWSLFQFKEQSSSTNFFFFNKQVSHFSWYFLLNNFYLFPIDEKKKPLLLYDSFLDYAFLMVLVNWSIQQICLYSLPTLKCYDLVCLLMEETKCVCG